MRATADGDPSVPGTHLELHVRDISAEQETREALRISEARHRLLADSARDVVWTMAPDGRITYVSPAIEAVRGYTPDEAMVQTIDQIHPPESAAKSTGYFIEMLTAIQQGRRPAPFRGDLEYYCKDGSTFWTEVLAFPVLDPNGQLVELVGVTRDLRDRRALESELRHSQRMESMGRMAAGVAHQMNNILAILRAAIEQPADEPGSATDAQQRLAMMLQSIDRASALTAQLLSFSSRQHIEQQSTRVGDLMAASAALLERVAAPEATLAVHCDGAARDAVVDVDRSHFEQVLLHLVANARDAMPTGSVVDITCGSVRLDEPLVTTHSGRLPPGEYATIAVRDTGTGMSAGTLEHLFEPFFTTKPIDKGTGLGLPTVFGILRQHQAGISVESVVGTGSCFTVYWPMHGREAESLRTVDVATIAKLGTAAANPTVLVVDDEPFLLRLTARAVERLGHKVRTASSGHDALHVMLEEPRSVGLIITDVRMPGMTGTELVDALVQRDIHVPVIFVSGQLDVPIPDTWPETVPQRFLAKPFRMEQLTQAVNAMLPRPTQD